MEELIVTYLKENQVPKIIQENFDKHFFFVRHCQKNKQLFFKHPDTEILLRER